MYDSAPSQQEVQFRRSDYQLLVTYVATKTWNGAAGDKLVASGLNWTPNGAPTAANELIFNTSNTAISWAGATSTIDKVNLLSGFTGKVSIPSNLSVNSDVVVNSGTLATSANVTIGGNYTQSADTALNIELDSTTGTLHGKLLVTGTISVNGALNITSSLPLNTATTFTIFNKALTGTFTNITLPTPTDGYAWNLSALYTSGQISLIKAPGAIGITPELWMDATDTGSLIKDGSNNISAWLDKSGNNFHPTQTTAGYRPAATGTIGTQPALRFATDDYLELPYKSELNTSAVSMFIVNKVRGSQNLSRAPFSLRNTYKGFNLYATNTNNWDIWSGTGTAWAGLSTNKSTIVNENILLSTAIQSGNQQVFLQGALANSISYPYATNDARPMRIGAGGDGAAEYFFDGDIAEILIYNQILAPANRHAVEGYLGAKYALPIAQYWKTGGTKVTNLASNWYDNRVPQTGRSINFDESADSITWNGIASISSLNLLSGFTGKVSFPSNQTITSNVTLESGTLATSANMTISGSYTQTGGTLNIVLDDAANYGKLTVTGTLTVAANLVISNLGQALNSPVTFTVFNKALIGQFNNILLPTPAAGYAWDLSRLYSFGEIRLIAAPGGLTDPLVFWITASDSGSLSRAPGNALKSWFDKSGNNLNFFQLYSLSQPLISTQNGQVAVSFDSLNNELMHSLRGATLTPHWCVFAVVKPNDITESYVPFLSAQKGNNDYSDPDGFELGNGSIPGSFMLQTNTHYTFNAPYNSTRLQLVQAKRDDATITLLRDGISYGSALNYATIGPMSPDQFSLGNGTDGYMSADIYEILIYNSELTTSNRLAVEYYLSTKYQIPVTLNIDIRSLADWDKLTVSGQFNASRNLEINLKGYTPVLGNSWQVVSFGSVINTFKNIKLPALSAGLAWNLSNLYVNGTIQVVGAPGGIGITPTLWLDADDVGSLNKNGSNLVAGWFDKSGNNYSGYQSASANQPTYAASRGFLNSKPALTFNYSIPTNLPFNASFLVNSSYSIFIVEARSGGENYNFFMFGTSTATNQDLHLGYRGNATMTQDHYFNFLDAAVPVFVTQTAKLNGFVFANGSGKTIFRDGLQLGTAAQPVPLSSYPGAGIGGSVLGGFSGDIAEIMMFNSALATANRHAVEGYLSAKYNLPIAQYWKTGGTMVTATAANWYGGYAPISGRAICFDESADRITWNGITSISSLNLLAGFTGKVSFPSNQTVTSNVVLASGTLSTSANMTIQGNYTQSGGTLNIVLDDAANYGKLTVTGTRIVAGALDIKLSGLTPVAGNSFAIFNGALTGQFSNINLPALTAGLAWNLSSLYTSGTIQVVQAPGTIGISPALWLDANDAGTVMKNGSNQVTGWIDKSGQNIKALQSNVTLAPIWTSNVINSLATMRFNGSSQYFNLDSQAAMNTSTYFIVSKQASNPGTLAVLINHNVWGANAYHLQYVNSNTLRDAMQNRTITDLDGSPFPLGQYNLITVFHDTNLTRLSNLSTQLSSLAQANPSIGSGARTIGAWSSSRYLNGDISEIIIYNSALSTPNRHAVEGYLGGKYNLPIAQYWKTGGTKVTATATNWYGNVAPATGRFIGFDESADWITWNGITSISSLNLLGGFTGKVSFPSNQTVTSNVVLASGTLSTSANMTIQGNYTQSGGTLNIVLDDAANYGKLTVTGTRIVAGALDIKLSGLTPVAGNSFAIFNGALTGQFSNINLPALTAGLAWNLSSLYTTGTIQVVQAPGEIGITPALWLAADDSGSVVKNGSNLVSNWIDKSGNNLSIRQSNDTYKPTYLATAYAGKPAIDFYLDKGLRTTGGSPTIQTVYTVIRAQNTTWNGYHVLLDSTTNATRFGGVMWNADTMFWMDVYPSALWKNGVALATNASLSPINTPQMFTYNATSGRGTSLPGLSVGNFDSGTIGGSGAQAEIIAYSSKLSTDNRLAVEYYLSTKYQIPVTLNIDIRSLANWDKLTVAGQFNASRNLEVSLKGYTPVSGNSWQVVSFGSVINTFKNIKLPALTAGLAWNLSSLYTTGTIQVVQAPGGIGITPALWLAADDSGTVVKNDSNLVSNWIDKSGNNLSIRQSNDTYKPTYLATAYAGKPAIDFYLDKGLRTTGGSPTIQTVYTVIRAQNTTWNGYHVLLDSTTNATRFGGLMTWGGTNLWPDVNPSALWKNGVALATNASLSPINTPQMFTYNATSGRGTSLPGLSVGNFDSGTIGGSGAQAEIIAYSIKLSTPNRHAVEGYLGGKYNLPIAQFWKTGGTKVTATATNWFGNVAPVAGRFIGFDESADQITWNGITSISSLNLLSGFTGKVSFPSNQTVTSNVVLASGTLATSANMTIGGNYTQSAGTVLNIVLDSTTGTAHGKLIVSGIAALNGQLNVTATVALPLGTTVTIISGTISGTFSSVTLPTLPPLYEWDTSELYTQGKLTVIYAPFIWDGGGGDNKVSTAANWNNNVAPVAGERVIIDNTAASISWDAAAISVCKTLTLGANYTGTLSMDNSVSVTGQLTLTKGTLRQQAFDMTIQTLSIGAAGTYINESTGDLTLGTGGVVNNGTLTLDAYGRGPYHPNDIVIRSQTPGVSVPWTGSGVFNLTDTDVQDQGTGVGAAVIVHNGKNSGNNGANFSFDPNPIRQRTGNGVGSFREN